MLWTKDLRPRVIDVHYGNHHRYYIEIFDTTCNQWFRRQTIENPCGFNTKSISYDAWWTEKYDAMLAVNDMLKTENKPIRYKFKRKVITTPVIKQILQRLFLTNNL